MMGDRKAPTPVDYTQRKPAPPPAPPTKKANVTIMHGDETKYILDALEAHRVLLEEIAAALKQGPTNLNLLHLWQCGCSHVNGANLATCAMCGRKPGER